MPVLAVIMRFEQLNKSVWAMTYLIVDEATSEAALVDPVYDFMQQYVDLLEKDGLALVYVIATHTHADHITACFTLQEQYDPVRHVDRNGDLGVIMHVDDERKSCSVPFPSSSTPPRGTPTIP